MSTISMFYGIIVRMLFMDTKQHHLPHLHVEYQGQKAVVCIPDGNLLEGSLPARSCEWCRFSIAATSGKILVIASPSQVSSFVGEQTYFTIERDAILTIITAYYSLHLSAKVEVYIYDALVKAVKLLSC